jgi:hypothetical protein
MFVITPDLSPPLTAFRFWPTKQPSRSVKMTSKGPRAHLSSTRKHSSRKLPFKRPNLVGVALPSALSALTAELASSEVARNSEHAQVRASVQLAKSICLYSGALTSPAQGSTIPFSSNDCHSSLDPPDSQSIYSVCVRVIMIMWQNDS